MPIRFDYHMHTRLSDGKNSHEEMVEEAIKKGFNEIGFSDHFCIKGPNSWAMEAEGIPEMVSEIDAVQKNMTEKFAFFLVSKWIIFPTKKTKSHRF